MKPIRNSSKAVIIQNQQMLLTKNKDDLGFFYLFPGGGQEIGETLIEAVYRECLEEIGAEITVKDLIHIREYIGKNHEFAEWDSDIHQVEFYFLCHLKDSNSSLTNGSNPDSNQVAVEWIGLKKIDEIRVYPKALGNIIKNNIKSNIYIGDVN